MTDPDAVPGALTDTMLEEMAGEGAEEGALTTMGVPPSPLAIMPFTVYTQVRLFSIQIRLK